MMELKSREQRRANLVIAGLLLLLILVFCLSFFIGRYSMSFQEAWQGLTSNYEVGDAAYNSMIVMVKVRLPRILGALLVGGSLAMSGAAFQGVFGNPLVSPDLLGTSSGAGLAASIAILSGLGSFAVLLSALAGGLLATLLTALISHAVMRQRSGVVVYVLVGLVVSALLEAGISITKYIADPYSDLGTITYWLMGSLAQLTLKSLAIVLLPILLGALLLLWGSYKINLLSFSDEEATSMGINVKKFRLLILFAATLLCASSVAAVGVVSWVGLVVPHMTRILIGPNNKKLIPASFLTGAIYLIMIDNLARAALIFEIPISILTGAIGAPVFIFLLLKGGKTGWK